LVELQIRALAPVGVVFIPAAAVPCIAAISVLKRLNS